MGKKEIKTEPLIYKSDVITEMVKAVGPVKTSVRKTVKHRDALIRELEEAAAEFLHNQVWQSAPGDFGIATDLNAVSSTAGRFLVAMKTATPLRAAHMRAALGSELRKACEENIQEAVTLRSLLSLGDNVKNIQVSLIIDDCVELITVFKKLADLAIVKRGKTIEATNKEANRAGKKQSARNTGDKARLTLIAHLAKIYQGFWGKVGVSRHPQTGEIYGPFIRFVEEAIRPLGIEMSGEAIAAYLRRRKLIGKSALFRE